MMAWRGESPPALICSYTLCTTTVMPFILRGFRGEATDIPAIKYEPDGTIPHLSDVPYRWVRASIYPVRDADGELREVVLMHEDITMQKVTEEQLLQTEAQYRSVFEATYDCLTTVVNIVQER